MSVYVDIHLWRFRNQFMCHMGADTVEELHAMALRLNIRRSGYQDVPFPHYDINVDARQRAIALGAIEAPKARLFINPS
jgi:hypothetical protein